MKTQRTVLLFIFLASLAGALVLINRDLFSFRYDTRLERSFLPEQDARRDYLIDGPISLKPGSYVLAPMLSSEGTGSRIYLTDADDHELFSAELADGTQDPEFPFEISGAARQVRIGIRYEPDSSVILVERIRITSEHVLYRDSLLRHLTLSLLACLAALWLILRLCFPDRYRRIFPRLSLQKNELTLFFLTGLTLAACYPLLDGNTYVHGEDMFFHLTRIRGLADSLRAGYFPVRDQLYWLHNYGYGVGFYYPDLFLYLPALMLLLGFDVLTAYKLFLILFSFLSVAAVWLTAERITKDWKAAAAAAVWMAFASYRLSNVYYRGAVGETQAAVFYPLIILGLYEIFYGKRERWPIFALGFFGMLSCHIISLTIALVLTALFLLTHIRRILSDRGILTVLLKSVLLAAGLSAYFWLPMLEQMLTNPGLKINHLIESGTRLNRTNYAFPVSNLLLRFSKWNFAWQADCIYPGWSLLVIPLLRIAVWKRRDRAVKTADFMLGFSALLLWMCTRTFPWKADIFLPFVTRIQFAYRLLLPASVMLCLSGGIFFASLLRDRPHFRLWLAGLTVFCFFITAFPVLRESTLHRTVEKSMFVMQDNRVSGAEYLPVRMDSEFPGRNADTVLIPDSDLQWQVLSHKRQRLSFTFSYELPEDSGEVRFSLPMILYTGFQGTLTDEDGNTRSLSVGSDRMGLVSVSNEGISRGTVTVFYEKTLVQRVGELLSLLTLSAALLLYQRYRRKHGEKPAERV